jgi:two-component system, chemotaxis family, chemotaxis protein CheY
MALELLRLRVLVVDDNDFMRDLVASMLREIGFRQISHASDGEEALSRIASVEPDLILCDIDMEPMDGLDFVEALRKQTPAGGRKIPVLMLTARNETQIVQWAIKLGISGYLVKPVKKAQLEAKVLTILERSTGGGTA